MVLHLHVSTVARRSVARWKFYAFLAAATGQTYSQNECLPCTFLQTMDMLCSGSIFYLLLRQCCAYGVVRLRSKNCLTGVRKTSCFDFGPHQHGKRCPNFLSKILVFLSASSGKSSRSP